MKAVVFSINSAIYYSNVSAFIKDYSFNSLKLFSILGTITKSIAFVKKACHCNSIFLRKTKLILALNHFIPRCPYYCTYFAFRRTGIHPPFITF